MDKLQLRILVDGEEETLQYRWGNGRWSDVPKVDVREAANDPDKGTFRKPAPNPIS
jgi:hypothetical protein